MTAFYIQLALADVEVESFQLFYCNVTSAEGVI